MDETAERSLGQVVPTADGTLTMSHPDHGECYHSLAGATAEAELLYIQSSGFAAALTGAGPQPVLNVLDVGLGLGYNALATLRAWFAAELPPAMAMVSLEVNRPLVEALASGEAPWQATWPEGERALCRALVEDSGRYLASFVHPVSKRAATWLIVVADAGDAAVPVLAGGYHFIWQDPFSPAKNPPLWQTPWFEALFRAAAPGAVMMTYSVARAVRDSVGAAGWEWAKVPALGSPKKHWLRASKSVLVPFEQDAGTDGADDQVGS